jgi:hypothetical protein
MDGHYRIQFWSSAQPLLLDQPQSVQIGRHRLYASNLKLVRAFLVRGGKELIAKLLPSSEWAVSVEPTVIRLSSARIPAALVRVCRTQSELLHGLGESVSVLRAPLKRHWWAWSAAAIVIALIVFVSIRMMPSPDRVQAAVSPELARVQDAAGWRLGTASDFDPDFVQWLREAQVGPSATVLLNLGDDHVRTIGHFLVRADGTRRLAIVDAAGTSLYDANSANLVGIARLDGEALASARWRHAPLEPIHGDALLAVYRDPQGLRALVLYLTGQRVLSAVPEGFRFLHP